jgi:hypothetical protein
MLRREPAHTAFMVAVATAVATALQSRMASHAGAFCDEIASRDAMLISRKTR